MEIRDLLAKLIVKANDELSEKGQPLNFDLEDFISTMESYWGDLEDIGSFEYENDMEDDENEDW